MRFRSWLIPFVALAAVLPPAATAAGATRRPVRRQALVFDARVTHQTTAGPGPSHVGHTQIAGGVLRDSAGRAVGRFGFTCTWTRVLRGGAALERCHGVGRTSDGRLDVAGASRSDRDRNSWRVVGGDGAYSRARGTISLRDISDSEILLTAQVTPASEVALSAGAVNRPAANAHFVELANGICSRAATKLAGLPPFPFPHFDPLHPDLALLPQVGAFFTRVGDPRPILTTLELQLRSLGRPAAHASEWTDVLRARQGQTKLIATQDTAALAADAPEFVRTVRQSTSAFRKVALTASTFGATRCVL
jgi:hypothetical protein